MHYLVYNISTEVLGPPISFNPAPKHSLYDMQLHAQSNGKLIILSYKSEGQKTSVWSWDFESSLVEKQTVKGVQARLPYDCTFALLVGKELFWLNPDKPEVHGFNVETHKRQRRCLKLE